MATCCDFGRKSFWQNKNKESSQSWATTEITWNMYWNRFLWNGMQHFFVFYTFWYIHDEKFSPSHNFDIKNNFLLFLRSSSALLFCNRSNYFSSISRALVEANDTNIDIVITAYFCVIFGGRPRFVGGFASSFFDIYAFAASSSIHVFFLFFPQIVATFGRL